MRIVKTVQQMQRLARQAAQAGIPTSFVPTMGCLHAGHVSLLERARALVGPSGRVVVSIYVNPTQFGPKEDFAKYPRTLAQDTALCRQAGVDLLFAPTDQEIYPSQPGGDYSTYVVEESVSLGMEGASRPTHFRGVTTVVAKLFHIVEPDTAVFGEKDFQQVTVIQRMVRDLNFRVKIVVAPTRREPDGLAMSSRNRYLSAAERAQAVVLWQAIQLARGDVRAAQGGVRAKKLRATLEKWIGQASSARVDYISIFDPATLDEVEIARRGTRLALAVFLGRTRLIDNGGL